MLRLLLVLLLLLALAATNRHHLVSANAIYWPMVPPLNNNVLDTALCQRLGVTQIILSPANDTAQLAAQRGVRIEITGCTTLGAASEITFGKVWPEDAVVNIHHNPSLGRIQTDEVPFNRGVKLSISDNTFLSDFHCVYNESANDCTNWESRPSSFISFNKAGVVDGGAFFPGFSLRIQRNKFVAMENSTNYHSGVNFYRSSFNGSSEILVTDNVCNSSLVFQGTEALYYSSDPARHMFVWEMKCVTMGQTGLLNIVGVANFSANTLVMSRAEGVCECVSIYAPQIINVGKVLLDDNLFLVHTASLARRRGRFAHEELFASILACDSAYEARGPLLHENIDVISLSRNRVVVHNNSAAAYAAMYATSRTWRRSWPNAETEYVRNVGRISLNENSYHCDNIAYGEVSVATVEFERAAKRIGIVEVNNNSFFSRVFADADVAVLMSATGSIQIDYIYVANNSAHTPWDMDLAALECVSCFHNAAPFNEIIVADFYLQDNYASDQYAGRLIPADFDAVIKEVHLVNNRIVSGSRAAKMQLVNCVHYNVTAQFHLINASFNVIEPDCLLHHLPPQYVLPGGKRPSDYGKAGASAAGAREYMQDVGGDTIYFGFIPEYRGHWYGDIVVSHNSINVAFLQMPGTETTVDTDGEMNGYVAIRATMKFQYLFRGNLTIIDNDITIGRLGRTTFFAYSTGCVQVALVNNDMEVNRMRVNGFDPLSGGANVSILDNRLRLNGTQLCSPGGCTAVTLSQSYAAGVINNLVVSKNDVAITHVSDMNKMPPVCFIMVNNVEISSRIENLMTMKVYLVAPAVLLMRGSFIIEDNRVVISHVHASFVSFLVFGSNVTIAGSLEIGGNTFETTAVTTYSAPSTQSAPTVSNGDISAFITSAQVRYETSVYLLAEPGMPPIKPGTTAWLMSVGGPTHIHGDVVIADDNDVRRATHMKSLMCAVMPFRINGSIVFRRRGGGGSLTAAGGPFPLSSPLLRQVDPIAFPPHFDPPVDEKRRVLGILRGIVFDGARVACEGLPAARAAPALPSAMILLDSAFFSKDSAAWLDFKFEVRNGARVVALTPSAPLDAGSHPVRAPALVAVKEENAAWRSDSGGSAFRSFAVLLDGGSLVELAAAGGAAAVGTEAIFNAPMGSNVTIAHANISFAQQRRRASVVSFSAQAVCLGDDYLQKQEGSGSGAPAAPTTKRSDVVLFNASFDTRGGLLGDRSALISTSPEGAVSIVAECVWWNEQSISKFASWGGPETPAVALKRCRGVNSKSRTMSRSVSVVPFCTPFRFVVASSTVKKTSEYNYYRRFTVLVALVLDSAGPTPPPVKQKILNPTLPPAGEEPARAWTVFRVPYDADKQEDRDAAPLLFDPSIVRSETPELATVVSAVRAGERALRVEVAFPAGRPALSIADDVEIRLSIGPEALACNISQMPARQIVTINLQRKRSFFASETKKTLETVQDSAVIASTVLARSSLLARNTARSQLLSRFEDCMFDPEEPLGFELSPLNMEVGTDKVRFLRGAVVGNGLVVLMFSALLIVAAFVYVFYHSWKRRQRWEELRELMRHDAARSRHGSFVDIKLQQEKNAYLIQERKTFWKSVKKAILSIGLTETIYALNFILFQGTISAAVSLWFYGPEEPKGLQAVDRTMALLSVIFCCGVGVWMFRASWWELPRHKCVKFIRYDEREGVRISDSESPDEDEVIRYILHVPSEQCDKCAAERPRNRKKTLELEKEQRKLMRRRSSVAGGLMGASTASSSVWMLAREGSSAVAAGGGGSEDDDEEDLRNPVQRTGPVMGVWLTFRYYFRHEGDWEMLKRQKLDEDDFASHEEFERAQHRQSKQRRAARRFLDQKLDAFADFNGAAPWYDGWEYLLCALLCIIEGYMPDPESPACEGVGILLAILNAIPAYLLLTYRPHRHWATSFYACSAAVIIAVQSIGVLLSFMESDMEAIDLMSEVVDELFTVVDLAMLFFDLMLCFCESPKVVVYLTRRLKHVFFHGDLRDKIAALFCCGRARGDEQQQQQRQRSASLFAHDVENPEDDGEDNSSSGDATLLSQEMLSAGTADDSDYHRRLRSRRSRPVAYAFEPELARSRSVSQQHNYSSALSHDGGMSDDTRFS